MDETVLLYVGSYLLLFAICDGAVTSPHDKEACVGDNVIIPWEYDDADTDVVSVIWSVNTSTDIMTYFSGGSIDPEPGHNVVAVNNNGSINITSATRSDTGTYQIVVTAGQTSTDQVEVLVCEPSEISGLKGTKSGSELKCEASNLGDPEAELYIKVNNKKKTSSSGKVSIFDKVECCLSGCAVQCMSGTDEYCKVVKSPTTTTTSSTTTTAPNPIQTVYIVIAAILGTLLLIICIILCCWLIRRRRSKQKKDNIQIDNIKKKSDIQEATSNDNSSRQSEIKYTDNTRENNSGE